MPSVGRIKQLLVVGLAAGLVGVAAHSASAAAAPIWLWTCHDEAGTALPELGGQVVADRTDGAECAQNDASLTAYEDGLRTSLSDGRDVSVWRLHVPPSLRLSGVTVARRVTELGAGQRYELATTGGVLESRDAGQAPVAGRQNFTIDTPVVNDYVRFGLSCDDPCTSPESGPAGADAFFVGLQVVDDSKPAFAVGGTRSPLTGDMKINVEATDTGSGLRRVTAQLGTIATSAQFVGNQDCRDITSTTGRVDMPINARCAVVGSQSLEFKTKNVLPDGPYTLTVSVEDWAGNVTTTTQPINVLNTLPVNTPTQQLSIGTSGIVIPQENQPSPGPSGGVAGSLSSQCRSPRLSVFLDQKPLRVRRGVPVLKAGKRYRFSGRLTCVINGRRRSAPKRTRIDILNTVGKKTVRKPGTRIRDKGRLSVVLSYRSSRVIIFRFTNSNGQRSQVRIRIRVAKR